MNTLDELLQVRVTSELKSRIEDRARELGIRPNDWLRFTLAQAAVDKPEQRSLKASPAEVKDERQS